MKTEPTGWSEGALMICTKCGTRGETASRTTWTSDWAEKTKMAMKKDLKEKQLSKKLRVMSCSCLGLCPENQQTVLLLEKTEKGEATKFLVFNPEEEPSALQDFSQSWLKERL